MVESLEIPDVINELSREDETQGGSESEYDSDTIVVNVPNRSSYRSRQNESLELPNQQEKEP